MRKHASLLRLRRVLFVTRCPRPRPTVLRRHRHSCYRRQRFLATLAWARGHIWLTFQSSVSPLWHFTTKVTILRALSMYSLWDSPKLIMAMYDITPWIPSYQPDREYRFHVPWGSLQAPGVSRRVDRSIIEVNGLLPIVWSCRCRWHQNSYRATQDSFLRKVRLRAL